MIVLSLAGALVGSWINWAIYRLGTAKRAISPWSTPDTNASPRTLQDRIPIIGWFFLRRDAKGFGKGFWIRPMIIEIVWTAGLPWFYQWQISGGLSTPAVPPVAQAELWFFADSVLIALLFAGTFIDFDQRLIPDWITIPGTIVALLLAAHFPQTQLPIAIQGPGIGQWAITPLHFNSPNALPTWHLGIWGLVSSIAIYSIWIFGLLPKLVPANISLHSLRFMLASIWRIACKKNLKAHIRYRRMLLSYLALWMAGVIWLGLAWSLYRPVFLDALYGAMLGLAMGGAIVWSIRIVASQALGQEAMGFGDVTLMAMIGAFLGWQPSLIVFALAPFAALVIVVVSLVVTRDNELAFGPYLSLAAIGVLFFWQTIWPSAKFYFMFAKVLIPILLVCLIIMGPLLILVRWVKERALGIRVTEEEKR